MLFAKTTSTRNLHRNVNYFLGPLQQQEWEQDLSSESLESILALHSLVKEDPEKVLQQVPEYITRYPKVPMLYNFLSAAYCKTGDTRKRMETINLLPENEKKLQLPIQEE